MKIYPIDTPEKLDRASDMVKWEKDRRMVLDTVKRWKDGEEQRITLEVSRNAHLYTVKGGKKSLLATMYVAGAREYVKELGE